jgi:hypothetical protein
MFLPDRATAQLEYAVQYQYGTTHLTGKRRALTSGRVEYVNAPMESGAPGHRAAVLEPIEGEKGFVHLTLYGETEAGYSTPLATTKCRAGTGHKRAAEWVGWRIIA